MKSAPFGGGKFRLRSVAQRNPVVAGGGAFASLAKGYRLVGKGPAPGFEQEIAVVANAGSA